MVPGIRIGVIVLAAVSLAGCGIVGTPAAGPAASATASPSAAPSEPEAGQCHANVFYEQIAMADDRLVPCDLTHVGETVHVGRFLGEAAAGGVPKLIEGATGAAAAVQRSAYEDCSAHADLYLGHSWIHPRVTLRIVLPDDASWQAGQRWYRCDLYESGWGPIALPDRRGSFKTNWPDPACFDINQDPIRLVDCADKHPSEYVGGFMLPAGLTKEPETDKELAPLHDRCFELMGSYLGMSARRARALVGVWFWWQFDAALWASGRRAGWCFTWTGKSPSTYVTGSAKGSKS